MKQRAEAGKLKSSSERVKDADLKDEDLDLKEISKRLNGENDEKKSSKKPETKETGSEEASKEKKASKSPTKMASKSAEDGNDDPECRDNSDAACKAIKPMCEIATILAYSHCRKTCKLCEKDKPKGKTLIAEFSGKISGRITLKQQVPVKPTKMSVCVDKEKADDLEKDKKLALIIHDGKDCEKLSGHFNPFHTLHGAPDSSMKHVGDLGNIKLGKGSNTRAKIARIHVRK